MARDFMPANLYSVPIISPVPQEPVCECHDMASDSLSRIWERRMLEEEVTAVEWL